MNPFHPGIKWELLRGQWSRMKLTSRVSLSKQTVISRINTAIDPATVGNYTPMIAPTMVGICRYGCCRSSAWSMRGIIAVIIVLLPMVMNSTTSISNRVCISCIYAILGSKFFKRVPTGTLSMSFGCSRMSIICADYVARVGASIVVPVARDVTGLIVFLKRWKFRVYSTGCHCYIVVLTFPHVNHYRC